MSSQDEQHQIPQQQVPMVFVPVSAPPQGQAGGGVAYPFLVPPQAFTPQTSSFVPLDDNNHTPQGGCRRWGGGCGRNWEARCAAWWNRPIGTTSEFFWALVFGTFAPVFAPLITCLMETSKLARLGALYGTGNFFLVLGMGLLHMLRRHGHHDHEDDEEERKKHLLGFGIASVVLGVILLLVACKKSWWIFYQHLQITKQKKDAAVFDTVVSQAGTKCSYYASFFISLFFPVIGTLIRTACNRTLQSRFGSVKGLAILLLALGAAKFPPVALLGLTLGQVASVHFRRAIIIADVKEGNEESIFSCWTKRCGRGKCGNNNNCSNENVTPA